MAFQFPDPNVTPEFEGDNGITYTWDATDGKWMIKGFSADLDDRYVNREGGDSMEGPLELTGADGNLKFGTAGSKIVSSSDTELAVINSSGIFYDGNISSERHLVNKQYVDDQIDEVVGLLGGIGSSNKAGVFTYQASGGITAAHWQFEGRTNPDYEYSGLNQINISKVDKAGNSWTVDDFPTGEVLRIEDESDGEYLVGEITGAADGGPASIQVSYTIVEANGTADGDQVISVGENLDHKYVERTGDSMVGDLEMQSSRVAFTGMVADEVALQAKRADGEDLTLLKLQNASVSPAVSGFYNIKIEGNTFYNGMRILGGSGAADTLWEVRGGSGEMKFFGGTDYQHNRLKQVGDAVEDDDALTLGQFKQELADFRDDVITELSFGPWVYSSNNVTPIQTRFYVRATNGNTNAVNPALVDTLIFNVQDLNGNIGAFDRVDIGELFTLSSEGIVVKYRVTEAPVNSGSQGEGRVIGVNFISQSQTFSFMQDQTWNVQLTEFADISVDELDDTYLRLDTSNDPLESELKIQTPGFGEGKLTLRGKRDNANSTCATIAFENQDEADAAKIGYITYYNKGTTQKFGFNHDISLPGDVDLSFSNGGAIQHNGGDRIVFNNATNGNEGSGLVVFTRPGNVGRRGITFRGKYVNADGDTVGEGDLLYSYTNSDEDAINYHGKTNGEYNILTRKALTDALAGFEVSSTLEHTPYIANQSGTKTGVNSSTPGKNQVAGFFTGSTADGSKNEYPGNFNSYLKCGIDVVSTQAGANNYARLPQGHDEAWTGTVTVINKNTGGMLYKNTIKRVQRLEVQDNNGNFSEENAVIRIWVREQGSQYGTKPIYALGNIADWTNISVVIEGYRVASS